MTAEIIQQGLNSVAATLNSKRVNVVIVAVGGAVNTLLLRTRESTTDVDFFYRTKTKHEDVTRVIVAADAATTKLKLGDQWLNNHTAVFIEVRFWGGRKLKFYCKLTKSFFCRKVLSNVSTTNP